MINRINDIIFGNIREGRMFDFEATRVELITKKSEDEVITIRRENPFDRIIKSVYEFSANKSEKNSLIFTNKEDYVVLKDPKYSEYKSKLLGVKQW